MKNTENKPFTAILRRPDYVSSDPDDQIYVDHVKAPTVSKAVFLARRRARAADGYDDARLTDYALVFVCEGIRKDLSAEVSQ